MNDIITEIIPNKGRIRVVVNGEESLWFSKSAFTERALAAGDSVELRELKEWLLIRQYPEALSKAVSCLAVRSRSRLEVRRKLESKGYLERTIELVLYKMEIEELLNDEAFAREWAEARVKRLLGKSRILRELLGKGVSRDVAERVWAELENGQEDETEWSRQVDRSERNSPEDAEQSSQSARPAHMLARKLLKRVENEPDPQKGMRKVLAAFARRGFSYQEAREAIKEALEEMREV